LNPGVKLRCDAAFLGSATHATQKLLELDDMGD
jgi:hypothetical protein